jgi:hypothetical protein
VTLKCRTRLRADANFFVYADEPMRLKIFRNDILTIYGERIEADIPLAQIVSELQRQYHVFVLWPANSPYQHSFEQYKTIFGADHVLVLEDAKWLPEFIGTIIGMVESKLSKDAAVHDLVALGTDRKDAAQLVDGIVSSSRLLTGVAAD